MFAHLNIGQVNSMPQMDIWMNWSQDPNFRTNYNWIQGDTIQVQNYNQVQGDNFQVFWTEQAANFIVPQTSSNGIGAPVAGLTNAQAWAQYGIAIAGAVAPSTATASDPLINGLILPGN